MSKSLDEFSCLFTLAPNIEILNLNNGCDFINQALNTILEPINGNLTTLQTSNIKELKTKVKRSNYDYGVVSNTLLDSVDSNSLMKIISTGIRDSGYIIILEEKNKSTDHIFTLLEEFDYGAISTIDIFQDYNLIMGKKLHMWGMD